jgi:hypothetical protein
MQRARSTGDTGFGNAFESVLGLNPAPSSLTDPEWLKAAKRINAADQKHSSRTPEQLDRARQFYAAAASERNGDHKTAQKILGNLKPTKREMANYLYGLSHTKAQVVTRYESLRDVMDKVWPDAPKKVKAELRNELLEKLERANHAHDGKYTAPELRGYLKELKSGL